MPTILLTGAGFSRNWGGWLADEAFEYLLGCADITPFIREHLWRSKNTHGGFEETLQELRSLAAMHKDERHFLELRTFLTMLEGMFHVMRAGYTKIQFEPTLENATVYAQPRSIRNFLCRFDAIFTLNQDTLLEQHYAGSNLQQGSNGKWLGFQIPGLKQLMAPGGGPYEPPGILTPEPSPYSLHQRQQPYFKLHGSSNWRTDTNSALLIMGGNKSSEMDQIPLLNWYRSEFRRMTTEPDARLMIIGYGFKDMHINEMIEVAAKAGTKLFLIDPEGTDVLNRAPNPLHTLNLRDKIQLNILGASRRPISDTLSRDTVERTKIIRFFPLFH
jgi:hypothetical protein